MSDASLMTAEQNAPGEVGTITIILADDHFPDLLFNPSDDFPRLFFCFRFCLHHRNTPANTHAKAAIMMAAILLAAGAFTGKVGRFMPDLPE